MQRAQADHASVSGGQGGKASGNTASVCGGFDNVGFLYLLALLLVKHD